MSFLPSPLTSPTATARGFVPTVYATPALKPEVAAQVSAHWPLTQWEPAAQALPQLPQLASSKPGLTQPVPASASAQLFWQAVPQAPPVQVAVWFAPPAAHGVQDMVPQ